MPVKRKAPVAPASNQSPKRLQTRTEIEASSDSQQGVSKNTSSKSFQVSSYAAVTVPDDDKEYPNLQSTACQRMRPKPTEHCVSCIGKQASFGGCRFNGIRVFRKGLKEYAFRGNQSLPALPVPPPRNTKRSNGETEVKGARKQTRSKKIQPPEEDEPAKQKGERVYPTPRLSDSLSPNTSDAKYALPIIADAFSCHIRREGWHEKAHTRVAIDSEFPGGTRPMIRIHNVPETRSVCDICSTSIFMGSYMCGCCGKEFCLGEHLLVTFLEFC